MADDENIRDDTDDPGEERAGERSSGWRKFDELEPPRKPTKRAGFVDVMTGADDDSGRVVPGARITGGPAG